MDVLDIKAIREELVQSLARPFDGSREVAIYGAGYAAARWLDPCFEGDVDPAYFIDDTPDKRGTMFWGKPVLNFEEAHALQKRLVVIPCSYDPRTREIMENKFRAYPIENAEFWPSFEEYVFCKHASEVLAVFDMLVDPLSKATYANMILTRMGKAEQNQDFVFANQNYFLLTLFAKTDPGEVFVDCGAYVGDTIERYLFRKYGVFNRIFAFEPVERNFLAMKARVRRLNREWGLPKGQIQLVQAGVGEKSYLTEVNDCGYVDGYFLSGENDQGNTSVVALDEFFSDQRVTFLKADIEGYEWKMLHGAEQVMRRDRPKIAICTYHTPFDMYRLALWLQTVCSEYKFAVRQHYCDIYDTVLYAYT